MASDAGIYVGLGESPVHLLPKYANRHGLISGATGTGKTVTLQTLAEGFSRLGVPVFLADVKGDLSGMLQPGGGKPVFEERAQQIGYTDYTHAGYPVVFWDVFGRQGHPVRATISEMGPLLLARLLELNDVQEGVLNVAFKVADDHGLLLLDLKDLRAMLTFLAENSESIAVEYGNVSTASIAAIQRALLVLEQQGAEQFFGEPALRLADLIQQGPDGRGQINILAASELMMNPRLYATFLLWMLSELFEELPEAGDLPAPKLAFFFDEAHLLFNDAPKALLNQIEQVVRLIRSKGVGIYFVTQNPIDIPDTVLGQLGNRVQHALRAFTPRDQKAVKVAAETFRANPKFDTAQVITELGIGEALCSVLDAKGSPTVVERTLIAPPQSRVGPADADAIDRARNQSPFRGAYDQPIDRESAFEKLKARVEEAPAPPPPVQQEWNVQPPDFREAPAPKASRAPSRRSDSPLESMTKSLLRGAASQLGRSLVRGLLGGLSGRRR